MRERAQALVVLPQVTLRDLEAATADLGRDELVRRMGTPPGEGDLPVWVRVLLEHPLRDQAEWKEWVAPFQWNRRWRDSVLMLRVRDWPCESSLSENDAVGTSSHRLILHEGEEWIVRAPILARGHRADVVRVRARTLGLRLKRHPARAGFACAPPIESAPAEELDTLADIVAERIKDTLGGKAFLDPYPRSAALSVLAATVRAVFMSGAGQRWHPTRKVRVARADLYRSIFTALGLERFFAVGRRFLEIDHPEHIPVSASWPPGTGGPFRDVAVLRRDGDSLRLRAETELELLGDLPGPAVVDDRGLS